MACTHALGNRALALVLVAIGLMLAAAVALAQDRSFDAAGVRIRYIEQGRGEPVVLLHGIDNSLQA